MGATWGLREETAIRKPGERTHQKPGLVSSSQNTEKSLRLDAPSAVFRCSGL